MCPQMTTRGAQWEDPEAEALIVIITGVITASEWYHKVGVDDVTTSNELWWPDI